MTTKAEFSKRILSGIDNTIDRLGVALEQAQNELDRLDDISNQYYEVKARIKRYQNDIKRLEDSKVKYQ